MSTKTKIDPGKDYRLLKPNEIIKAGDQYLGIFPNTWIPSTLFGKTVSGGIYRRRIEKQTKKQTSFSPSFKKFLKVFESAFSKGEEFELTKKLEQFLIDYDTKSIEDFVKTYFSKGS